MVFISLWVNGPTYSTTPYGIQSDFFRLLPLQKRPKRDSGRWGSARLFPLTKERSKPAVPLGGKYRLVDVPISNCINSGLHRVFVMTQFLSASLHRHISQSYKFDHFSRGFVEILAAEQTPTSTSWYEGTADAVRKNLVHLTSQPFEYLVILSGDQLYRMDYLQMLAHHIQTEADLTVATIPVEQDSVAGLGIMQMNDAYEITRFEEKPKDPELQKALQLPKTWYERLNISSDKDLWLASMGIYIFNRKTILELLDNAQTDFGKHIIPGAIQTHKLSSYVFQGYWEDVGTIKAFFEANLDLTSLVPKFNFFDMQSPVFTRPRFLPASKVNGGHIAHSLLSDGCIVQGARLKDCMLGIRSIVGADADLEEVVMMGGGFLRESGFHRAVRGPRLSKNRHRKWNHRAPCHHRQKCQDRKKLSDHSGW